jgi:hypothetical protein
MGRHPIGNKPLTNAEKVRRYRENLKAKAAAVRETVKAELRASWEPELKGTLLSEQRKKGRELAKKADQSHEQGRITGICETAAFFIGKDRVDITQIILSHFMIDHEKAAANLEADKRTKSLTLKSLVKAKAWGKPQPVIK